MQADTTTEQIKKEFQFTLSKFAHEIRNPVALISSELQLMASSHPELTEYTQWDDLMGNLDYIKELLNDFSDYNNAGKLSLTSVNPAEFLTGVLSCEKSILEYLGIKLETDIPTHCKPLLIDRVKMRQALLNLLRNARESIEHPHGKISVRLKNTSHGICISIQDNGCGMTQKQLDTIFSPFVTYKSGGTGLGLAITRQIIEAHSGHIEVTSSPDHGSTFLIFLG